MRLTPIVPIILLSVPVTVAANTDEPKRVTDRRSPDYIRCVTSIETGSLAKRHKVCKTNAEWDRVGRNQRGEANDMIDRARGAITTNGS